MYTIANDYLQITVKPLGAELASIYGKKDSREYLWSGDARFWGKQSPVLFPIVGALKDNAYEYNGQHFEMPRHGFARDRVFELTEQSSHSLTMALHEDETTLAVFPFQFNFSIIYELRGSNLHVSYKVINTGDQNLYFSVGGHPAFRVPLEEGLKYDDYYLLFNRTEDAKRWPISKEGLIGTAPLTMLIESNRLSLSKELFYKDALVFKHLASDEVQLRSDKSEAGINFSFQGFPFLGIWAAKDADFVCIEPWCGIADSVNASGKITEKEGIIELQPAKEFLQTWSIGVI